MKEIWKDIKGYEDHYRISKTGKIFSKKHNRFLNPWLTYQGYYQVELSNPTKKFQVHRLIAIAFIDNPLSKPCINHINSIRSDNCIENLEWVTVSENNLHAKKTEKRCPHCNKIIPKKKYK